ncbi:C40 family peptidase [Nocardioides jensenii]|uniref:C40 family peptidase n=1 Tax=Nocardioides jensenii TaxID=1843 RepID=UPI0009E9502F|nr:C40 family peptidase [Nocardioides jensenii]
MPATPRMPARLRALLVLPLMVLSLLVAGTMAEPPTAEAQALSRAQRIHLAYNVATRQIGDPYRYGAAGPGAFDCSGLIHYSFRKAGFRAMPRTSSAQYRFTRHIRKRNLRQGDLVFFHSGGRVYHAAIYVGRKSGRVVILHAPRSGTRVRREFAWTPSFYAGTLRGR